MYEGKAMPQIAIGTIPATKTGRLNLVNTLEAGRVERNRYQSRLSQVRNVLDVAWLETLQIGNV